MKNNKDSWHLALQILGRRSHSEYELRQKLYGKGCTADEIDDTISRLLSYGYVNDTAFATQLFAKYLSAGKYSLTIMICKLKQHGLSDTIVKSVTSSYDYEEELSSALKMVNSKFKSSDMMNKEKIYRFLATKGFSSSAINKVFQQIGHDEI
ncbi:MAG: regulatory protein RecX [Sporomusaceae bacterium]|nr:regulatory protein RecX [Sporomusaceae bacterium]